MQSKNYSQSCIFWPSSSVCTCIDCPNKLIGTQPTNQLSIPLRYDIINKSIGVCGSNLAKLFAWESATRCTCFLKDKRVSLGTIPEYRLILRRGGMAITRANALFFVATPLATNIHAENLKISIKTAKNELCRAHIPNISSLFAYFVH